MPLPDESSSFDAIAMQSVLSRARDNSRFEAPPVEASVERRRGVSVSLLLTLLAGLVVAGVVAGYAFVTFFRDVKPDDDVMVTISVTDSGAPVIASPQDAVRGYLDALAAGDIEKALTFGPLGGDGSVLLLTPENHQKMATQARPSEVQLLTDDPLATEVKATYQIAGQTISSAFRVTRQDDGSYRLAKTTVTVLMQVAGGENLPLLVNGVEVDHSRPVEVVPGSYAVTTGLPFITYPDSNSFTIQSLGYTDTTIFPLSPQLTDAGRSALLERARTSLATCIASHELAPTGCPNGIRAPRPVVAGSTRWQLLNDPWQAFNPTLSAEDQTIGTATVTIATRVSLAYVDGRTSGKNDRTQNVSVSATMLGREATEVQVVWDR